MSLRLQTIGVVLIIIGALILVGRGLASNFGNLGCSYSIVPGILMLIVAFLSRGGASGQLCRGVS